MRVPATPAAFGPTARPFETSPVGYTYAENVVPHGTTLRSREGSVLYVDSAAGGGAERGRLLIPYRDPRGFPMLFVGRDVGTSLSIRAYCGTHLVSTMPLATSGIGFPSWTVLGNQIVIARRGDPLRVLGLDDGCDPYFETIVAQERDLSPFDVSFDDNEPYLRDVPDAVVCHAWQERLWFSDGDDFLGNSNGLGDFEAFPVAAVRDVSWDGSNGIRAISSLGDALVVFHYRGITVGFGDPANGGVNFTTRQPQGALGYGCVAPRSVVKIGGALWFLSQNGQVCRFNGAAVEEMTRPIRDLLFPQTRLSLDSELFRRVEASSFPDAVAVYYEPWRAYVVMFEGETAGVWDRGVLVNVDTLQAFPLSGFDAQALCVKAGDEDMMLSLDRYGVVYAQDRGFVETTTIEDPVTYVHTFNEAAVGVRIVTDPVGPMATEQRQATTAEVLMEHLEAVGPVARAVVETGGILGDVRLPVTPQVVMHDGTANRFARYLGDATERADDFVIGTDPVQADGNLMAEAGLSGATGRNVAVAITNTRDAADDDATLAEELRRPRAVGIVSVAIRENV